MRNICRLSGNAREYLSQFYCILDGMESGMRSAGLTDSISHNFIVQMIPHHEAAIKMSENVLKYTCIAPLRKIAENIITEQTKSIADMERILPSCEALCNSSQELALYQRRMDLIINGMLCRMGGAPETNMIGVNFMREMIPHHQGAIRMSENALKYNICPCLEPVLCAIITSQRRGVREMETLLHRIRAC